MIVASASDVLPFPLKIASVNRGHGSFLNWECVNDINSENKLLLWVYLCKWSLFNRGNKLIDWNETRDDVYADKLKILTNKTIFSMNVEYLKNILIVRISGELTFEIAPSDKKYEENDQLMIIYLNNKSIGDVRFDSGIKFYSKRN